MANLAAVSLVIGIAIMNAARVRNAAQLARTPPVPADWLVHGYVSCLCNKIGWTFVAETAQGMDAATCTIRCAGKGAEFYDCIPVATATGLAGIGGPGLLVPVPLVRHETVAATHGGLEYRYACICYGSGIRFVFGLETAPTAIYTYGGVGAPRDCNIQCRTQFNARGVGCVADVPAAMEADYGLALDFARKPLPNPPLWFAHGYESCFCTKDDIKYIAATFGADCEARCTVLCGAHVADFLECLPVATRTGTVSTVGEIAPPELMRHETYALPDRRHTVFRYACVCYGFLTGTTKETGTAFVFGVPNEEKGIYTWGGAGCSRSCKASCKSFGAKAHGCFPDVPAVTMLDQIEGPAEIQDNFDFDAAQSPRRIAGLESVEEGAEYAEHDIDFDAAQSPRAFEEGPQHAEDAIDFDAAQSPRTGGPSHQEFMQDIGHGEEQEPPTLVRQP